MSEIEHVSLETIGRNLREHWHDITGPHERAGHRVANDWAVMRHFCVDCGLSSTSASAIEERTCDPSEAER